MDDGRVIEDEVADAIAHILSEVAEDGDLDAAKAALEKLRAAGAPVSVIEQALLALEEDREP